MKNNWYFEHAENDCPKCKEEKNKENPLNLFLGIYKGKDAQKYFCDYCGYVEINTLEDLMKKITIDKSS
jgi:hypothetical protein